MMCGEMWDLARVSDDELLKGLHASAAGERRSMARVIAHLAEVDDRRLHLRAGNSSLFDYCVRRLGLSEGSAFRRGRCPAWIAGKVAERSPLTASARTLRDLGAVAVHVGHVFVAWAWRLHVDAQRGDSRLHR